MIIVHDAEKISLSLNNTNTLRYLLLKIIDVVFQLNF